MITQERLKELFDYREDGNLVWKQSKNHVKVGSNAGCLGNCGYIQIMVDSKTHQAHSLVYLFHHGFIPDRIDHKNQNKTDNKIENLRDCSASQNAWNQCKRKTNKSGYKGVYFNKQAGKFHSQITVNYKKKHLGFFATPEEAHIAYCKAAKDLHGEFARFE